MTADAEAPPIAPGDGFEAELLSRRWLSPGTAEIELSRPAGFRFTAGQSLSIVGEGLERRYSMVSSPREPVLTLCVRHIPEGTLSPLLVTAAIGTRFRIGGPWGYFTFRESVRPAVFVATGSGIAPFVSMVKCGARPLLLLHGVRAAGELYYRSFLGRAMEGYLGCLSGGEAPPPGDAGLFPGRVTACMQRRLPAGSYDFYLCGNQRMVRDATLLADRRFPGSRVFTEVFF